VTAECSLQPGCRSFPTCSIIDHCIIIALMYEGSIFHFAFYAASATCCCDRRICSASAIRSDSYKTEMDEVPKMFQVD